MTDAHGSTGPGPDPHAHEARPGHDGHAQAAAPVHIGWKQYSMIGLILAIITALEVWAVESHVLPSNVVIPMVLILTAAKFFLVVLYYMHLKVDDPIFGRVFWAPLFLAVLVVVGMILLFHVLPTYGKFSN